MSLPKINPEKHELLRKGLVIPASPLALDASRRFDERHQRALYRYYIAAGAGGVAVGVHTTQFEIRDSRIGLFEPLLRFAATELDALGHRLNRPIVKVAGVCGGTPQARREAELAASLGYDAALLSLAALRDATEDDLLRHCREIAQCIPLIGFYLQPAVGGRMLPHSFWRRFAEIENVVAIKIAPFNRYQTLDVVRAVALSGREHDIALYTGNDDSILVDLLTPFSVLTPGGMSTLRIVGGLLGQWAVWTRTAVHLLEEVHQVLARRGPVPLSFLMRNAGLTDANAVIFDAAHGFAGCIPGIHEILRRQGLLATNVCLNPKEVLSPGQDREIARVRAEYPWLPDDDFVARYRDAWLS